MRLVIADDSTLVRRGVVRLLDDAGIDVVGEAGDADGLLALVGEHRPDVAIADIRMPPTFTDEGLRAASTIRERYPETGVLVLSQYVESGYALELVDGSIDRCGYLLKDRVLDPAELVAALDRIAVGEVVVDPALVAQLVSRRRERDPLGELTPREREILGLMAEGLTDRGIAERLWLTPRTVETHVRHILSKLELAADPGSNRRVRAVLAYLRAN